VIVNKVNEKATPLPFGAQRVAMLDRYPYPTDISPAIRDLLRSSAVTIVMSNYPAGIL